ncbi:hypothetical protein CDD81_1247 [Ophiocordyceps australis]|uniref:Rhodopsin domain-containing protein n=1 Tax=Ophiocordyceps australis TaxID=1399860 RepID=A0A2C5XKR0_9HYPO|nr:hypothetical protein CDD81_1247 [Ophiocordyceps australis]
MAPPPGVVPNFERPESRDLLLCTVISLGVVFSSLSAILHLANRALARRFGLVEFFLIAAWAQFLAFQFIIFKGSLFPGVGRHQWNVQLKDLEDFLFLADRATRVYGSCIMCLKVAILVDWLHLFVPTGKRNGMFWAIHIVIWSNVIFYMSSEVVDIVQCHPMEKIWNPFYKGGSCPVDIRLNNLLGVVINLVSDLTILALPQWTIWHLKMSKKRKIGISILFTIGIFICVLGALRLMPLIPLMTSEDRTYHQSILAVYSSAEVGVGFLIIGLPSVPKVYKALPYSQSLTNLLRSIRSSTSPMSHQASDAFQSRLKRPIRKRRGLWEITELEETSLDSRELASWNGDCQTVRDVH